MDTEIAKTLDEYLDRFIASDLVLIKIKDDDYPINSLKKMFLERIKERGINGITSYTFLDALYLEKV